MPAPTLVHEALYGTVESVPMSIEPAKKSTLVIVPPAVLALALTVIVAGALNVVPLVGAVIVTDGGVGAVGALTTTFTAADVAVNPTLLVALAVSAYEPMPTFPQVVLYGAVVSVPINDEPA